MVCGEKDAGFRRAAACWGLPEGQMTARGSVGDYGREDVGFTHSSLTIEMLVSQGIPNPSYRNVSHIWPDMIFF